MRKLRWCAANKKRLDKYNHNSAQASFNFVLHKQLAIPFCIVRLWVAADQVFNSGPQILRLVESNLYLAAKGTIVLARF